MTLDISGVTFSLVGRLDPERGPNGAILEFMPQSRYRNFDQLSLNPHGTGPFCRFRLSSKLPHGGVYGLTVDGVVVYIGECTNLSERFGSRGYGAIQPRNCFVRGQSTNCNINNLVLQQARQERIIKLWFHQTAERKDLEASLIARVKPPWNTQLK